MKAPKMTKFKLDKIYSDREVIKAQKNRHKCFSVPELAELNGCVFVLKKLPIKSKRIIDHSTRVNATSMRSLEILHHIFKAVKSGKELPPIIVDDDGIVDGFHRYNIWKSEGFTHIYAFVKKRRKS